MPIRQTYSLNYLYIKLTPPKDLNIFVHQYLADGRLLDTADNTMGKSRKLFATLKNARFENSAKFHETNENVEELFRLHTDFQYTMQIPV